MASRATLQKAIDGFRMDDFSGWTKVRGYGHRLHLAPDLTLDMRDGGMGMMIRVSPPSDSEGVWKRVIKMEWTRSLYIETRDWSIIVPMEESS